MQPFSLNQTGTLLPRQLAHFVSAIDTAVDAEIRHHDAKFAVGPCAQNRPMARMASMPAVAREALNLPAAIITVAIVTGIGIGARIDIDRLRALIDDHRLARRRRGGIHDPQ